MNDLEEALAEVLLASELAPALDILERRLRAVAAGYFCFPRQFVGALGSLLLTHGKPGAALGDTLPQTNPTSLVFLAPETAALAPIREIGGSILLFGRLSQLPLGERGSAGIILARTEQEGAFTPDDLAMFSECLPALTATYRRISRFKSLTQYSAGLEALIEKRLGACAALCSARGEVLWISTSARDLLEQAGGQASLQGRIIETLRALAKSKDGTDASQFVIKQKERSYIFGKMSFVRESPDTSVHYVAVELQGSDVSSHAKEVTLSPAERGVYAALLRGASYPAIARERFVSLETVRSQVKTVFRKFGVRTRFELMAKYRVLENEGDQP